MHASRLGDLTGTGTCAGCCGFVSETRTIPRERSGLPIRAIEVRAIDGPDRGLAFTSERDRISIGSAEGNDVRLTDPTVSRFHLALSRDGDRMLVHDLGSTNGTRIGPVVLENTHAAVKPDVVLELHYADERADLSAWDTLPSVPAVRERRVIALAGAELVVPGPRVARATERFARALHPGAFQ